MFLFERTFGQQPETYLQETEQKLLSTSLALVAVETSAVMESRIVGEGWEIALKGGEGGSWIRSLYANSSQPTQRGLETQIVSCVSADSLKISRRWVNFYYFFPLSIDVFSHHLANQG